MKIKKYLEDYKSQKTITITKGRFRITITPELGEEEDAIKIANDIEALEYEG